MPATESPRVERAGGFGVSVFGASHTHRYDNMCGGIWIIDKWVCLKMVSTPKPNGFHDHYPYEKWLFHWEYTLFSDKPKYIECGSNTKHTDFICNDIDIGDS